MGLCRPPAEVDVGSFTAVQDQRVCVLLDAIAALAFQGITPPADPTPEDVRATQDANARMAQLAEQVQGLRAREPC